MSTFTIQPAGVTDTGHVRPSNQDHFLATGTLVAVADGMGDGDGGSGERASRIAIDGLKDAFAGDPTAGGLVEAVRAANRAVLDRASSGTTIAAVARVGDGEAERLVVVNVGDSRVYLHRQGELTLLSADHSRVADLVRAGEITEAQASDHSQRHLLTLALGVGEQIAPSVNHVRPEPGDRLLLCTDGLFNEVSDGEMAATLSLERGAERAATRLIGQAMDNGGADNVTAVVVELT